MKDDWSICLLPHYHRDGRALRFMIEPDPVLHLDDAELALFEALRAGPTLAQLRAEHPDGARLVAPWCERGVAVALPPPAPPGEGHVLIVEPHLDDAVLSCGGQLLLGRGARRATVLTVVRWSEHTKFFPSRHVSLDRASVSALRLAEGMLAARRCGYEQTLLDELDFPIRLRDGEGPPGWPDFALLNASKSFAPSADEVDALAARLFERIVAAAPSEVWMPLGVGENPDHVWTAAACLRLLEAERGFFAGRRVCLYEDLLPFPRFAGHVERIIAVHRRSGALRRIEIDITDVFAEKLGAVSLFASQIDMGASTRDVPHFADKLTASAAAAPGSSRRLEVMYEVEQPPRRPAHSEVCFRPLELDAARLALAPWIRQRRAIEAVLVLCAASFGHFKKGMDVLAAAFPNARIDVRVAAAQKWEAGDRAAPLLADERASLDVLPPDTHVLVVGDASLLDTVDRAERRFAFVASFGDAVTALRELVGEADPLTLRAGRR